VAEAEIQLATGITPGQILAFLDTLNPRPGMHERLLVQQLLTTLVTRDEWPSSPPEFRALLAPLVCSSQDEQREFYAAFDRRWPQQSPEESSEQSPFGPAVGVSVQHSVAIPGWPWLAFGSLPLLIFAGAVAWALFHLPVPNTAQTPPAHPPASPSLPSRVEARVTAREQDGPPIPGATVYYLHRNQQTDPRGEVSVQANTDAPPFYVLVTHASYEAVLVRLVPSEFPSFPDVSTVYATMRPKQGPHAEPPPPPPPAKQVQKTSPAFYFLRGGAALVVPALVAVFLLFHRLRLRRWTAQLSPQLARFDPAVPPGSVYSALEIRKLARHMRRPRPSWTGDLAGEATVAATVRAGGRFTPVSMVWHTVPEYLFLIERIYERDQLGRLYRDLAARLKAQHVRVECFEFESDPRLCRATQGPRRNLSLQELAARYPRHTVLVFCEPRTLADRFSLQPAQWLKALAAWSDRAILCDLDAFSWPRANWNQAILGTPIFGPTLDGLTSWTEGKSEASTPEAKFAWAPYPAELRDPIDRWISEAAPSLTVRASISASLRAYLGPNGYLCLRACAIYPTLYWPLTLYLAARLISNTGERTAALERMVRLPWFRYGSMPDWLRIRLIAGLTSAEEKQVRQMVDRFLAGGETVATHDTEAIEPLEIAERWTKSAAPLQDYVFLSFMWGRKLNRLAVRPPGRWLLALMRVGVWWQRRMAPLLALLIAFAAAAWSLTGYTHKYFTWIETVQEPKSPPQPTQPQIDPFLARALDVAASQVGQHSGEGLWQEPFVTWCFDVASELVPEARLTLRGSGELEQWTSAINGQLPYAYPASRRPSITAGVVYAHHDPNGDHVGIVETASGDSFAALELGRDALGKPTVIRRSRTAPTISYGFIDYSQAPTMLRLPDAEMGLP
jgi:hypothetical protein